MSNDFERIWHLSLPDDWHPGYFWCVTFRIPGGVQYVEALTAAIGLLTKTKTWARDNTREGAKTVAATWEEALYERPMDVQQLDCIWLGPTVTTPEDRANVAAAIIQQVFIYLVQTIIDAIAASQTKIQWIEARAAEWQWYGFNPSTALQLGHLWDAVEALSPTERAAYVDDCVYMSEFAGLKSFMDGNPFGWLNELSSWLMDWLNTSADAVFDGLNGFAALIGGSGVISYAYDHGGGGGGSGFGATCSWSHDLDFTTAQYGFAIQPESRDYCPPRQDAGSWVSGIGFQSAQTHNDSCQLVDEQVFALRIVSAHYTQVSMTSQWSYVSGFSSEVGIGSDPGDLVRNIAVLGENISTWNGDADLTWLFLFGAQGLGTTPPNIVITSLHVEGVGPDPYA